MYRITWLSLNASHSHTSLALPILHTACFERVQAEWHEVTATIKDDPARIAARVFAQTPDVLLATAYLFTKDLLEDVLKRLSVLLPTCRVVLGGPEFLGDNQHFLKQHPNVFAVIRGEGESVLPVLLESDFTTLPAGVCYLDPNGNYVDNNMAFEEKTALEWQLSFVSQFRKWDRPFIQLETTRGCPNRCSFCTSNNTQTTRRLPVSKIREILNRVQEHGIREIRILDRTFNAFSKHAIACLTLFRTEFPEMTFHLEVHPAGMDQSLKDAIKQYPPKQLHLEVGIQSLHPHVLEACNRLGDIEKTKQGLTFLCQHTDAAVHVDLLAGLPRLRFQNLLDDLSTVMEMGADEIQLETLKLLPGTPLAEQASLYGLQAAPNPPYDIMQTSEMNITEILKSCDLSRLIDQYYNHPTLKNSFAEAVKHIPDFTLRFLNHLITDNSLSAKSSLQRRAATLHSYLLKQHTEIAEQLECDWLALGHPAGQAPGDVKPASLIPIDANCISGSSKREFTPREVKLYKLTQRNQTWWYVFDRTQPPKVISIFRKKN